MRDPVGLFVEDFPDCPRFREKYPDLDKSKVTIVEDQPVEIISTYDKAKDGLL